MNCLNEIKLKNTSKINYVKIRIKQKRLFTEHATERESATITAFGRIAKAGRRWNGFMGENKV